MKFKLCDIQSQLGNLLIHVINPTDSLGRWLFPKIKGKDSCRQTIKNSGGGKKVDEE